MLIHSNEELIDLIYHGLVAETERQTDASCIARNGRPATDEEINLVLAQADLPTKAKDIFLLKHAELIAQGMLHR